MDVRMDEAKMKMERVLIGFRSVSFSRSRDGFMKGCR